jgi:hypothetical protein
MSVTLDRIAVVCLDQAIKGAAMGGFQYRHRLGDVLEKTEGYDDERMVRLQINVREYRMGQSKKDNPEKRAT